MKFLPPKFFFRANEQKNFPDQTSKFLAGFKRRRIAHNAPKCLTAGKNQEKNSRYTAKILNTIYIIIKNFFLRPRRMAQIRDISQRGIIPRKKISAAEKFFFDEQNFFGIFLRIIFKTPQTAPQRHLLRLLARKKIFQSAKKMLDKILLRVYNTHNG